MSDELVTAERTITATTKLAGSGGLVALYGLTLNEWVAIASIAYAVAQLFLLSPKLFRALTNFKAWITSG